MIQKKKAGRPAAKKVATVTVKNEFPLVEEVDKIEEIRVEKPVKTQAIRPFKKRRSLHPVEVNGTVRMLTKFSYNSIKRDTSMEIILPKNSPFNELDDCEGC